MLFELVRNGVYAAGCDDTDGVGPGRLRDGEQTEADDQQRHRQSGSDRRPEQEVGNAGLRGARQRPGLLAMGSEAASQGEGEQEGQSGEQEDAAGHHRHHDRHHRVVRGGRLVDRHAWEERRPPRKRPVRDDEGHRQGGRVACQLEPTRRVEPHRGGSHHDRQDEDCERGAVNEARVQRMVVGVDHDESGQSQAAGGGAGGQGP